MDEAVLNREGAENTADIPDAQGTADINAGTPPDTTPTDADGSKEDGVSDAASREFLRRVREIKSRKQAARDEAYAIMCRRYAVGEDDAEGLLSAIKAEQQGRSADRLLAALKAQCGEVKELYPEFDLAKSMRDRTFFGLCYRGLSLKSAYEAVHRDEHIANAMAYAVQRLRQSGTENAQRPAREGALSAVAGNVRTGASHLDAKGRRELIRRAQRGEIIKF